MRWPSVKIRDAVTVLPFGAVVVGGEYSRIEVLEPGGDDFQPVRGQLESHHRMQLQALITSTSSPPGEASILGGSNSAWIVTSGR